MLQSPDPKFAQAPTPSFSPVKTVSPPLEQATIGKTLVIKGEISGSESLYIDGRVEGSITLADNRVTIGRSGQVHANITAKELVIMGKVQGNVQCSDRLDIRSEGSLTGDVVTYRICIEEGAVLKGGVEVRTQEKKDQKQQAKAPEMPKAVAEVPKTMAAAAGNA